MQNRRKFLKSGALIASASIAHPLASFSIPTHPIQQDKLVPLALKKGDKVVIISPAGAVYDVAKIKEFKNTLINLGFVVTVAKSASKIYGYLAGSDEERAADVNEAFADKSIKGIFCTRGGWGCARILDLLDYNSIAENPKFIMGFSDITSLLIGINTKVNLITFHGPVGLSSWDPFSVSCFNNTIILGDKNIFPCRREDDVLALAPGIAQGELIGGNLSVFVSLIGTNYLPDFDRKILFLEELNEDPYKIDRMLMQINQSGIFDKLAGLVFGVFSNCHPENIDQSFPLLEVIKHHVLPLNIPVIYNAPFGHTTKKWTIPIGALAEINADNLSLELLEPAVLV
jgi:muramoyltetrapeptide carboxypeptidase